MGTLVVLVKAGSSTNLFTLILYISFLQQSGTPRVIFTSPTLQSPGVLPSCEGTTNCSPAFFLKLILNFEVDLEFLSRASK